MARKSIDFSRSLLKFQSAKRERRDEAIKTPEPQSLPHPNKVSPQEWQDNEKRKKKDATEEEFALCTQKNSELAKSNTLLLSRISEMEKQITHLSNENSRLKTLEWLKHSTNRRILDKDIINIERELTSKFDDIFSLFKRLKGLESSTGHIPEYNFGTSYPATSTPLNENQGNNDTQALISAENQFAWEIHSADTPKETSPKSQFDDDCSADDNRSKKHSLSHEYKAEYEDKSSYDANNTVFDNGIYSSSSLDATMNRSILSSLKIDEEKKRPIGKSDNCDSLKVESQKQIDRDISKSIDRISNDFSVEIEDHADDEKKFKYASRRSSRARKPVNYAVPSLRKKMRRESSKFIDAVSDDVLRDSLKPQGPEEDLADKVVTQNSTGDIRTSRINSGQAKKGREPLRRLNSNKSQNKGRVDDGLKCAGDGLTRNDYSIFDFMETN